LFHYFKNKHADRDYASVVALVRYAVRPYGKNKDSIIERVVRENKTLVTDYPGEAWENNGLSIDTTGMEFVGDIIDGGLYISDEPYFKDGERIVYADYPHSPYFEEHNLREDDDDEDNDDDDDDDE
jgi:hypothetical protein